MKAAYCPSVIMAVCGVHPTARSTVRGAIRANISILVLHGRVFLKDTV